MFSYLQMAISEFEEVKMRFSEAEQFTRILAYMDIPIILFLIFALLFTKRNYVFYIFALMYSLFCAVKIFALVGYCYMLGDFTFIVNTFASAVPMIGILDIVLFAISGFKLLMFMINAKKEKTV